MQLAHPRIALGGGLQVGVVCSGPDRDESDLWFAIVQAISEAQATIELSSPYLVPPPILMFVLQLAAARGVRVRVYTNGPKTEAAILDAIDRQAAARTVVLITHRVAAASRCAFA